MKGKKVDHSGAGCGIARALDMVGDRWSLLIIRQAFYGQQRFGEFQKSLGLAKNILSTRLKKLVGDGIFRIEEDPASALSHRYILTRAGERLCVILVALWQWGAENCFKDEDFGLVMVDKVNVRPLAKVEIQADDGRILGPGDFRVVDLGAVAR